MALISTLPEEIRLLAIKNREADGLNETSDNLEAAFVWDSTPEGGDYWEDIYEKYSSDRDDQIVK